MAFESSTRRPDGTEGLKSDAPIRYDKGRVVDTGDTLSVTVSLRHPALYKAELIAAFICAIIGLTLLIIFFQTDFHPNDHVLFFFHLGYGILSLLLSIVILTTSSADFTVLIDRDGAARVSKGKWKTWLVGLFRGGKAKTPTGKITGITMEWAQKYRRFCLQYASPFGVFPISDWFADDKPLSTDMVEIVIPKLREWFGDAEDYWRREALNFPAEPPDSCDVLRRRGDVYSFVGWNNIRIGCLFALLFAVSATTAVFVDTGVFANGFLDGVYWLLTTPFALLMVFVLWLLVGGWCLLVSLASFSRMTIDSRRQTIRFGKGVFMLLRNEAPLAGVLRVERRAKGNFGLFEMLFIHYMDTGVERTFGLGILSPRQAESVEREIMQIVRALTDPDARKER